ncbi:MAG: proline--tRNA ligase [Candidatus Omnitrophota bacterium]
MRWSQILIPTLKEDPSEAEAVSHKLMIRAGLIRKLASGFYSYLPLGLKILQKIEKIVREEMNAKGAQEVLLPSLHPPELWQKTGRYSILGDDMYKLKDRQDKEFVLGPTHEEIITTLVANDVKSYKDLPLVFYQIQTKFRDEPRPRFGVIRSREFIMKDAYSFDKDTAGLEVSYKKMYDAYCNIFSRCGLDYLAVEADPGFMGGGVSHEFMVLAESGEDKVVICKGCGYAATLDKAEVAKAAHRPSASLGTGKPHTENLKPLQEMDTPGVSTVEKVSKLLGVGPDKLIKTLIYIADGKVIAVLLRGDRDLSEIKLKRFLGAKELVMADAPCIEKTTSGPLGFSGPVGLKGVRIIADYEVEMMQDFVTGANKRDKHLVNVNLNRDFSVEAFADLRYIASGDACPKCQKPISLESAIEVGHVFKLGTKYSEALGAKFLDEKGKEKAMIMGCYGIGINRIAAAAIEQGHDKDGIIWPGSIAPFDTLVLVTNSQDEILAKIGEETYESLKKQGRDVLLDDRSERAGIKFKDADLLGIPTIIIVGEKYKKDKCLEIKNRKTGSVKLENCADLP